MNNLGQSIREKREKQKMTIEDLSQKTKISIAVLKDIEAGKFDRYEGDEAYVKMYLKKISQALNMDAYDVTQQYVALTQEIELTKIQEKEEKEVYNEDVVKKGKEFTFKVPQLTRKASVYEDKSHITIIRAVIVLIIVCLIIVVFWYGFYSTRKTTDDPEFKPQNTTTVEGNMGEDDSQQNNTDTPSTSQDDQTTSQDAGVEFTRNDVLDFSFTLPEGNEEFTLKIEFYTKSWAKLLVNGRQYDDFKSKIYHNNDDSEPETVELTFKTADFNKLRLRLGCSLNHRYYINGQEIPLTDDDSFEAPSWLNLELVK